VVVRVMVDEGHNGEKWKREKVVEKKLGGS